MTLPAPNLDDRRFQDLVDEAKRLITEYCPEWTNHNVSDPGVALIELFAYMTEMTLFRLNRVPDRLYTVFLNLVGIEQFPAQAGEVRIPDQTEVSTRTDAGGQIVFVTDRDLHLRQPVFSACLTAPPEGGFVDRWDDMRFLEARVRCFDPLLPGAAIYFGFSEPLPAHLLRFDITARPSGLGIAPGHPPLAWEASTEAGWAKARVRTDTTGGLNRDGIVELAIPPAHDPMILGDTEAYWVRVQLLAPEPGQYGYGATPELTSVTVATVGGVVTAHHATPVVGEVLGTSDGSPGQRFMVSQAPVLPRRPGETVRLITAEGSAPWEEVDHFGGSGPDDPHFVWHSSSGEIEFGPQVRHPDGSFTQHGGIPVRGAQIGITGYRTGGGAQGNVGAETLRVLRTTIPFVTGVINADSAAGGVDHETVEEAKARAPLTLRTGRRAVTTADVARLAGEATGELARTHCVERRNEPGHVRLLLVPAVTAPIQDQTIDHFLPAQHVYEAVERYLEPRRLIGTTIDLTTPFYEGVSISVLVRRDDDVDPGVVEQRVLETLYRFTHPLVGGPTGRGIPWGWTVTAEEIRQLVNSVDGVAIVDDVGLFAADLRTRQRLGGSQESLSLGQDALFLGFHHRVVVP